MQNLKEDWLVLWKMTRNLASFHQSTFEKCKIGSLMESFYPTYEMHELEIYRGVMCHENEEWCKMWREIDLSFQNWHEEFDEFWPEHSKISKICTLMGCFWPKCIMFEFRKYRGVMFDSSQGWYKIWKKTDLCFQKWHEEFGKFSPEHLKVSKLGLWIAQLKLFTHAIQNLCSYGIRKFPRKLSS